MPGGRPQAEERRPLVDLEDPPRSTRHGRSSGPTQSVRTGVAVASSVAGPASDGPASDGPASDCAASGPGVVGSGVVGSRVVGSGVVGSDVAGSGVVGSGLVGSEAGGAGGLGWAVPGSDVVGPADGPSPAIVGTGGGAFVEVRAGAG